MKSIIITGASSGIGAALARAYAGPGIRLGLVARDAERLDALAAEVTKSGAVCETGSADVRDPEAIAAFVETFEASGPLDLMIVNAGIFDGRRTGEAIEDAQTSVRMIETNLVGAINTVHAALPGMRKRGAGQIALISSLAGMTPLAGALGYSASKAALLSYGLGLRQTLRPMGIELGVICPGFVDTPITKRHLGAQPFRMSAETAARKIIRGIDRRWSVVAFPLPLHLLARPSILVPDIIRRVVGGWFSCSAGPETGKTGAGASAHGVSRPTAISPAE